MEIGKRIEEIMNREGLNPYSISVKIGTSDTVIRNILSGRNYPGYEVINKIIQTFDWVDAKWFITGEGKMIDEKSSPPTIEDQIKALIGMELDRRLGGLPQGEYKQITYTDKKKVTKNK